ncbi:hypothetical protein PFNF135_00166 [Plasmodium falciparum NF135/5.C10]|uniref:Surface antigen n=1 Tax=Plasmodium falciparum NF135/5.C10 TaxID=1036726 RepID=W4IQE0_PLAFA|nr:hypothetical protein PFNF135_00166 [Plasmodium falciparum NF135/5.C10]
MKQHYSNILLFFLPLNILAYNKNKPYITKHTPTNTSRVLSEYDLYMSNYDNDEDMKSVKENFDRQTSQRFEEYEERMNVKRQKCKEQRDKDMQKIILKDKNEKSLAEKVEKGCLKCGCGLGGVAASVGLIGTLTVNELKKVAMASAIAAAKEAAITEGAAAGEAAGFSKFIGGLETTFSIKQLGSQTLETLFTSTTYTNISDLPYSIYMQYQGSCIPPYTLPSSDKAICSTVSKLNLVPGYGQTNAQSTQAIIESNVKKLLAEATAAAEAKKTEMTSTMTATFTTEKTDAVHAIYMGYHTAIIASVVVILVIVLVMAIIYLILRYRRKKKMNKKLQYVKLLKE